MALPISSLLSAETFYVNTASQPQRFLLLAAGALLIVDMLRPLTKLQWRGRKHTEEVKHDV